MLGPAEVSGSDVDDAKGAIEQQTGEWIVSMEFTSAGAKKFQTITGRLAQLAADEPVRDRPRR